MTNYYSVQKIYYVVKNHKCQRLIINLDANYQLSHILGEISQNVFAIHKTALLAASQRAMQIGKVFNCTLRVKNTLFKSKN
jgi:hypothetical protein